MSASDRETDGLSGVERRLLVDALDVPKYLKPLLRLLAWRQHRNRCCWPSIATLARDLDKSRATIYRQLGLLRDAQLIEWWKSGDNHRFSCTFQQVINSVGDAASDGETESHDETEVSHDENATSCRKKETNVLAATRISNELFWSNLQPGKLRYIVRTKDLTSIRQLLQEGKTAFGWKLGETSEIGVVALFKAAESRTEVLNPVGWLIGVLKALKPGQSPCGVRPAEERWARSVVNTPAQSVQPVDANLFKFVQSPAEARPQNKNDQLLSLAREFALRR